MSTDTTGLLGALRRLAAQAEREGSVCAKCILHVTIGP